MVKEIITPEYLKLTFEKADFVVRCAAALIDYLILFLASTIFIFLLSFLMGVPLANATLQGYCQFLFFIGRFIYFFSFENGPQNASFGKKVLELSVIRNTNLPLTTKAVFIRSVTREIEISIPLQYLLSAVFLIHMSSISVLFFSLFTATAVLYALTNEEGMRIGDIMAGTFIVSLKKSNAIKIIHEENAVTAFSKEQLSYYGIMELQTLAKILRQEQSPATSQLRKAVAERIMRRINWHNTGEDEGEFLSRFYSAQIDFLERKKMFGSEKKDKHDV